MGKKVLLDKITITDATNTNNDGNVDFITCVYDEDDDVLEVFDKDFQEVSTSDQGYSGEYFRNKSYMDSATQFDDAMETTNVGKIFSTDTKLYTLEDDGTDIRLKTRLLSDYSEDADVDVGVTGDTITDGFYVDESADRAYIVNKGSDDVAVFVLSTGAKAPSGESFSIGAATYRGIWKDEATDKLYIGDVTNKEILVYDISTATSPTAVPSEDIDLTNAIAGFSLTDFSFVKSLDRIYASHGVGGDITTLYEFKISDSSYVQSYSIPSVPGSVSRSLHTDGEYYLHGFINTYGAILGKLGSWSQRLIDQDDPIFTASTPTGHPQFYYPPTGGEFVYATGEYPFEIPFLSFPTTLVYPNARDYINENIGTYWRRNPTNHILRDGDNYIYFQPFTAPPYFLKRSQPISSLEIVDEDLVDDLEVSITNYTEPTSNTATDGSITVTATGTHTPFTYQIIGPNNSNESPQASGTFNNLTSGTYRFRVIDDNNVKRDLPPFQLNWTEEVLSDYGVLYDFEWYDVTGANNYKLEIVKRGYAGSTTTLSDMGSPPFSLSLNPNGSEMVDTHIISLNATITLISGSMYTYLDIAQGNDEDYGVIFYVDNGGFEEYWRGMISPRSYYETISGTNHYTSFTATDRTGDLQNLKYRQKIDTFLGSTYNPEFTGFYGGKKTLFQILHYCMRQLKMDMGYRIALNLFEDSHNTASSDDPLNQTKVDTDSYFDDNNDMTLQEVVTHILKPFKAFLIGYDGYWYIIDKENLTNSSISYVEYDKTGTYVTNSSWSPRIDFKGATESNRFRWVNNAQISTTEVYKDVLLTLDTKVINKGSLTPEFVSKNIAKSTSLYLSAPTGFKDWQFNLGDGEYVDRYVYKRGIWRGSSFNSGVPLNFNISSFSTKVNQKYNWVFKQSPEGGGDSKLIYSKPITTGISDDFRLNIKLTSGINNALRIGGAADEQDLMLEVPYIKLRWKMKVGNYFYNFSTGTWSTTNQTNVFFIDSPSEQNFEVQFNAPPVAQADTSYKLLIYLPDVTDYDLNGGTSEAAMITALKAVDTTVLSTGNRLIARYKDTSGNTDVYIHHYYELQYNIESGSEPDVVNPTDFNSSSNPVRWRLVALKSFLEYGVATAVGYRTTTYFKEIKLSLLPNGQEPPEEALVKWRLDGNNKVDYEDTLYHFDAPPNINSPMELFFNHFFTGTRTPTDTWNKSGEITRRIQDHLVRWLARKLKRTRFMVSGDVHYNTLPTPVSVFRDTQDDNALYMLHSGTFDFEKNMITGGTYVEMERDTAVSISSVSSGVSGTAAE